MRAVLLVVVLVAVTIIAVVVLGEPAHGLAAVVTIRFPDGHDPADYVLQHQPTGRGYRIRQGQLVPTVRRKRSHGARKRGKARKAER